MEIRIYWIVHEDDEDGPSLFINFDNFKIHLTDLWVMYEETTYSDLDKFEQIIKEIEDGKFEIHSKVEYLCDFSYGVKDVID